MLENAEQADGLSSAIGIVLGSDSNPICAGLIATDGQFLTAHHCVEHVQNAGHRIFQASSGSALNVTFVGGGGGTNNRRDWAVYSVDDPGSVSVRKVSYQQAAPFTEATLIAAWPHLDDRRDRPEHLVDALHFPRDNLCEVVAVRRGKEGTSHLACHTVIGMSGSPVFLADSDADTPAFVGLIVGGNIRLPASESDQLQLSNPTFMLDQEFIGLGGNK